MVTKITPSSSITSEFRVKKWSRHSDTVVSNLFRHKAGGVVIPGLGELAHLDPLVLFRIIFQHVFQNLVFLVNTTCDDND